LFQDKGEWLKVEKWVVHSLNPSLAGGTAIFPAIGGYGKARVSLQAKSSLTIVVDAETSSA